MGGCYSHVVVEPEDAYGLGPFPPCFYTRLAAEEYLKTLLLKAEKSVVELRVLTLDEGEQSSPISESERKEPK